MILPVALLLLGIVDSVNVTFRVSADVPDTAPVCIVGSIPTLGGWDESGALWLNSMGLGRWEATARVPRGVPFSFVVIRGGWTREAVADGKLLPETWCEAREDTIYSFSIDGWEDEWPRPTPARVGMVHVGQVSSRLLPQPRDVWVWVPSSTGRDAATHYPVLYVHDGQDAFGGSAASMDPGWTLDGMIDSLHAFGRIPPVMVVAVGASAHRALEYADTTLGEAYVRFVLTELKPHIDSLFPTMPGREHTATLGLGLGGLVSFLGAWWHPEIVGHAACLSPPMLWGDEKALRTMGPAPEVPLRPRPRLFLSTGQGELDAHVKPSVAATCSVLVSHGWVVDSDLVWEQSSQRPRGPVIAPETIASALVFLFGGAQDRSHESRAEW